MKQIIIRSTICCLLFVFLSCGQEKEGKAVSNHEIQVTLIDVKEAAVGRSVQVHGIISSGETANLSFKLPGIIRSLRAKEGDAVKKGMLLAELDFTEVEAQYVQAQESYDKQLRDHKRVEALFRDSVATREQWQNSLTALALAEQSLKVIDYNRRNAAIHAPADGVVIYKHAGEGEYVNPGQPVMLLSLHTDKRLLLKAGVSVSHWQNLRVGDRAEWETEAFPGQVFSGRVTRIAQAADLQSGLYQVEIELDSGKRHMTVGMFAEAAIQTQQRTVYKSIPSTSLHDGQEREAFVYIPDGKRVKKIPVTVAFIQDGQAYISSGLDSVARIIHEGSAFLSPYSTISVQ